MLFIDEEEEIKIEYFDHIENDPLSERLEESENICSVLNYVKYETDEETGDVPVNNHSDQKDSMIPVEDTPKWYKSIDSSGQYICRFCELAYITVATLRRHIRLKHKSEANNLKTTIFNNRRSKKHTCHVCKRRFNSLQELINHVQGLHDIENIHSCHLCLAQFSVLEEKVDHLLNIHDIKLKSAHVCKICGYQTFKLSHLNQHHNTHLQVNKKKCTYCNYSTNYLPNLRIHERIHLKEYPYVCDYEGCSYRSASKSGLSSHQLKHYREKNMLFCDKCSYSTVYKISLKKHIVSHSRNSIRSK